jgi:hypothetical protein
VRQERPASSVRQAGPARLDRPEQLERKEIPAIRVRIRPLPDRLARPVQRVALETQVSEIPVVLAIRETLEGPVRRAIPEPEIRALRVPRVRPVVQGQPAVRERLGPEIPVLLGQQGLLALTALMVFQVRPAAQEALAQREQPAAQVKLAGQAGLVRPVALA